MYEFGTIVLVPFPFTNLQSKKVRPALIVSNDSSGDDIIVAFVGSRNKGGVTIVLEPSDSNGLKQVSYVRLDHLATLEKCIVIGTLGEIPFSDLQKYTQIFHDIFGFKH